MRVHHVAIIASDYERSRDFYARVLGCTVIREVFREVRQSWKCDLAIPGDSACIELFSFPNPRPRVSNPEAAGLRHLAFATKDLAATLKHLEHCGVAYEAVRVDEYTGAKFTFFKDPDGLPLELYEVQ
ncbi:MAG: VOC family protein [Phycisphaerales bacterium]